MATMTRVKRAVVGGYVKADVTGTGQWDYGRITDFDKKTVTFVSVLDNKPVQIQRDEVYKATAAEVREYGAKIDSKVQRKKYDHEKAGRKRQAKDRAAAKKEKAPATRPQGALRARCVNTDCKSVNLSRLNHTAKDGSTHRCRDCGVQQKLKTRNLLEDYYASYERTKEERTPSGRPCVDSGDPVAQRLRGMDLDDVYELTAHIMETESAMSLKQRYEHLNYGMQRMNLGNRIRTTLRDTGQSLEDF